MSKKIKAKEYMNWNKTMTNELTPLEVSKQLKDFVLEFVKNGLDRRFIHGSFDIIETELNEKANIENRLDKIFKYYDIESFTELEQRLESYEDLVGDLSIEVETNKENQKKLKALEIIKNKEIDVLLFKDCPDLDEYNEWASDKSQLNKEEYNLLKEVLL